MYEFDSEYNNNNNNNSYPTIIKLIIDTGAIDHIVNNKQCFSEMRKLEKSKKITCANKNEGADMVMKYVGEIIIIDNKGKIECLTDVLYTLLLTENLFSLRRLRNNGLKAVFHDM